MITGLMPNEEEALGRLRADLAKVVNLREFRIFGSKARGDSQRDSDIDVMIEISEYNPEVEARIDDIVYTINLAFDVVISLTIFGSDELVEGPMSESPIYKIAMKEGISL